VDKSRFWNSIVRQRRGDKATKLPPDCAALKEALWRVCLERDTEIKPPSNPIRSLLGKVFSEIQRESVIVKAEIANEYGYEGHHLYYGGYSILQDRLQAVIARTLECWALEYKFFKIQRAPDSLLSDFILSKWLIDECSKTFKEMTARGNDRTSDSTEHFDDADIIEAETSDFGPPPFPRILPAGMTWPQYRKREHQRLDAEIERAILASKQKPPKVPPRTKAGKKYQALHYDWLALRFCGLKWTEIQACVSPFYLGQRAYFGHCCPNGFDTQHYCAPGN
jgi:hypothetical protein